MSFQNKNFRNSFTIVRRSPKHPLVDSRGKASLYFHRGLVASLVIVIVLVLSFQGSFRSNTISPYIPIDYILIAEDIPETKQTKSPPPPRTPAIPVSSEEVNEQLDEIEYDIEVYDFDYAVELPSLPIGAAKVAVGPRPLVETFPQFPESEINKGYEGIIEVKLHIDEFGNVIELEIINNTTRSKKLENLVIQAAQKSKYHAARDKANKPIAIWTSRTYTFKRHNK